MSGGIQAGAVVDFHFQLSETSGELLDDSAARGQPMQAVIGSRVLQAGVEEALIGRSAGDRFEAVVPPEKGYGVRRGGPQPVPRSAFPGDSELEAGTSFMTRTPDGRPIVLWVDRVEGDQVWVDPHHPLAGRTLVWRIEVLSVRPATPEEVRMGRPLDA